MHRIRRAPGCSWFTFLLVLLGAGPVAAQFDDTDWELLLPQSRLVDVVEWNGRIVGADADAGMLLYDPATSSLESLDGSDGLASNRILSLVVDDDGRLWAGTADAGLVFVEPNFAVRAITSLQDQGRIRALAVDGDFLYYASPSGGGAVANGFPEQAFTADLGLPSNDVVAVAAHDGRAWFATPAGIGLFDRRENVVRTVNAGLPGLDVVDVAAGPDGVFAAVGADVYRLDESDPSAPVWTLLDVETGLPILDLEVDNGRIAVLLSQSRIRQRALGSTTWEEFGEVRAEVELLALHLRSDGGSWSVGRRIDLSQDEVIDTPVFWSREAGRSPALDALYGTRAWSLELDGDGGVWIGCFPPQDGVTHWRADGSVQVYARADAEQDEGPGDGWLGGVKRAIERDARGDLWVGTFADVGGLTRFRPDLDAEAPAGEYLNLRVSDDVLKTRRVLDLASGPRGWLWVSSDGGITPNGRRNLGLDVLVDLDRPLEATAWVKITADASALAGDDVPALAFDGDRYLWMAIRGVGLQRFDLEGVETGGDLLAASVDSTRWRTLRSLPTNALGTPLTAAVDVTIAPDGRIWVATEDQGTFAFRFDGFSVGDPDVTRFATNEFANSLITNAQRVLQVDADGFVWSGGEGGLHRLAVVDGRAEIRPFTNAANFLTLDLGRLGADVLSPLPGTGVRSLAYDAERRQLYVGTDAGVARVRLDDAGAAAADAFDVTLRPNPIRDGDDELLVTGFEGEVELFVYTLSGRLVHRIRGLRDGDRAWDTRNVVDERVVSGMYLVRIVRDDGAEIVRTVAVER